MNRNKKTSGDAVRKLEEALSEDIHTQSARYESGQDMSKQNSSNSQHRRTALKEERKFTHMAYKIRHPDRVLNEYQGIAATVNVPHNQWDDYLKKEHEREPTLLKTNSASSGLATQLGLVDVAERNSKKSKPQLSKMYGVGF